jgi:hypothetical protein
MNRHVTTVNQWGDTQITTQRVFEGAFQGLGYTITNVRVNGMRLPEHKVAEGKPIQVRHMFDSRSQTRTVLWYRWKSPKHLATYSTVIAEHERVERKYG